MRTLRDDLPIVLSFYSRYPVGALRPGRRLTDAAWAVPIAGLVVALPAAAVLLAFAWLGAPYVGVVAAIAFLVVTTGALHEDGLADCADGFWGGATVDDRLRIMRDSRLGTYGALALAIAVAAKIALLGEAVSEPGFAAALLLAGAVASRTVALYPWVGLPPARADGVASAMGRPSAATFRRAALIAVLTTSVLLVPFSVGAVLAGAVGASAAARIMASLADDKIGGHSGDVIGATVVVADLAYLAAATLWRTATGSL